MAIVTVVVLTVDVYGALPADFLIRLPVAVRWCGFPVARMPAFRLYTTRTHTPALPPIPVMPRCDYNNLVVGPARNPLPLDFILHSSPVGDCDSGHDLPTF